jgi:hypothetical protein
MVHASKILGTGREERIHVMLSMNILDRYCPTRPETRKGLLKGCQHVVSLMTAIIDQKIQFGMRIEEVKPHFFITLVADRDGCADILELFAVGVDVESMHRTLLTKYSLPHAD